MHAPKLKGHIFALITALIWGTTLVAARSLIQAGLRPVEIIFARFFLAWIFLSILRPRGVFLPTTKAAFKADRYMILAGVVLMPFYFLFEKTAVSYTTATNTSLFIAMAPLFIALLSCFVLKRGHVTKWFFIGAFVCLVGVFFVVTAGDLSVQLSPRGDVLALFAGVGSAVYSLLSEKVTKDNVPPDRLVRMQRVFMYGLISLVPLMPFFGFRLDFWRLIDLNVFLMLVYLGLGASATAFILWNEAIVRLGAVSAGLYIYLLPVITIIFARIVLGEALNIFSALGAVLILCGLMVAENIFSRIMVHLREASS